VPTFCERQNIKILIEKLSLVLENDYLNYEIIFIDDDSPDNTISSIKEIAFINSNVKYISRIGRSGLSSAVVEGIVASTSDCQIVIDADLQHDLTMIPKIYSLLQDNNQLVICGRDFSRIEGLSRSRQCLSKFGNFLLNLSLHKKIHDPLTGFFGINKVFFDSIVRKLDPTGFKILYEILTLSKDINIVEIQAQFFERLFGKSKLNFNILLDSLELFLNKTLGKFIPIKFFIFCVVGLIGSFLNLSILFIFYVHFKCDFLYSQILATFFAIILNYFNNSIITYRHSKKKISIINLIKFIVICSFGACLNLLISYSLFNNYNAWWISGFVGLLVGSVWNFSISRYIIWVK